MWTPFTGNYDYLTDQQTGQPDSDIVGGTTSDFGFFVAFDDNGISSSTDGSLGFRIRFDAAGDNKNPANFKGFAWVGIDADLNGSIDAFLGLNFQGNSSSIEIIDSGSGANTSPSTTTISNSAYKTYATSTSNYDYRQVNYLTDGGTTNDMTPLSTGDPDYYASFLVPFADVAAFLAGKSINITDQTPLRYVVATSTQANSLNQDLGGVNGGVNSTTTWEALGGFSQTVTANGTVVPEPTTGLLALFSVASLVIRRRR